MRKIQKWSRDFSTAPFLYPSLRSCACEERSRRNETYSRIKSAAGQCTQAGSYNPRKKLKPGDKEYEKIKNSILEFGFADPLVVNADMTIVGGHQRLSVAMELGYTEVPCAVVDVDKTREKALNIALNKITGAWDDDLLAALLGELKAEDFDLSFTGFEPVDLEKLLGTKDEAKEDGFDVESELKQPAFSNWAISGISESTR